MADDLEPKKLSRRQFKAAVTRHSNKLERLIAERSTDLVKAESEKLRAAFGKFEAAHEVYHSLLENIDELEASDEYFFEVERNYTKMIKTIGLILLNQNNLLNWSNITKLNSLTPHPSLCSLKCWS